MFIFPLAHILTRWGVPFLPFPTALVNWTRSLARAADFAFHSWFYDAFLSFSFSFSLSLSLWSLFIRLLFGQKVCPDDDCPCASRGHSKISFLSFWKRKSNRSPSLKRIFFCLLFPILALLAICHCFDFFFFPSFAHCSPLSNEIFTTALSLAKEKRNLIRPTAKEQNVTSPFLSLFSLSLTHAFFPFCQRHFLPRFCLQSFRRRP